MTEIAGRIAVVTGGSSGIGRGIAEQLIDEGATVVITGFDRDRVETTAAEIGAVGLAANVADPVAMADLAAEVMQRFGRVDILVNNAGVGPAGRMVDLTLEDWRWITDVNYFGVVHGLLAFLPLLRANPDGGHIVNTTSMATFLPLPGLGAYTATKSAVHGLSEVLAMELAEEGSRVKVTVMPPGPVRTDIRSSTRNRPTAAGSGLADVDLESAEDAATLRWISPREAGQVVTEAIRADAFLALTHPEWIGQIEERFTQTRAQFERYPVA
ncbi:MAG: hypothetical protein BGO47_12550 [Microbacterium sp. 67-17]|uniref:SDR family oxidoreductase n=1 Tax=Microbacterium sp. 67-17 TaxID=1895782 RepID=UPI00095BA815|nr:SDR family NAD(P)-dependent oxidoreductase [Microbacterium sp. 67-17]OJW02519.1 MAG: hypothetical protein BGO47_12550 [Microbacterium sp. 67-17]